MRILIGAMRDLFVAGVSTFWDLLEIELESSDGGDEPWNPTGSPFERLSSPERLVALARVAGGLADPDVAAVDQTAIDEAAVASLFDRIRDLVEMEVRGRKGLETRKLLAAAAREALFGRLDGYPLVTSADLEAWEDLIDALGVAILRHKDHMEDSLLQDQDPIPAAPTPAALEAARDVLRRTCGRPGAHRF